MTSTLFLSTNPDSFDRLLAINKDGVAMNWLMQAFSTKSRAESGAWISVIVYAVLMTVKLVVGYRSGSLSLRADGLNNVTDMLSSVAVMTGIVIAKKPRDDDHPYGHSRAETVASMVTSFVMMVVGIQVLHGSILRVIDSRQVPAPDLVAAWTALGSALIMFAVFAYNHRLAAHVRSGALAALAKDNLSDALISVGTVVGVVGSQFDLPWLDGVVALVIGGIICRTSWTIFAEAARILTDGFDQEKLQLYRQSVLDIPGVSDVSDVKARFHGRDVVVDVTIQVNPNLDVVESHDIADAVEAMMKRRHRVKLTHIHVEPHSVEPRT